MTISQIWDLGFTCFEVFIGVGIIWLLWIEPLFPSKAVSVPIMTVVAALAAAAYFVRNWQNAKRTHLAAQKQIEAAAARYESEVG